MNKNSNRNHKIHSGFRTVEKDTFYHQSDFFYRFLKNYPEAVEELKELLPLFQSIFGSPIEFDYSRDMWKLQSFDGKFLLPAEKIVVNYSDRPTDYGLNSHNRQHTIPDYIKMPDDHEYKVNEDWYKRIVEENLLWELSKLRAENGNAELLDYLNESKELKNKTRQEFLEQLRKINTDENFNVNENDLLFLSFQLADKSLKEHKLPEDKEREIDDLLAKFWNFYEKFHAWINKYHLYRAWIRRSFFISLLRGLKVIAPAISFSINLPQELQKELHEDQYNEFGFTHSELPTPPAFQYKIIHYVSGESDLISIDKEWTIEPYSLFYSPTEYEFQVVKRFEDEIEKVPYFETEVSLLEQFSIFVKEKISNETTEKDEKYKSEFKSYIHQFPLFKDILENRNRIAENFRQHIKAYLAGLLPIMNKHLRTNEGARPKFERIEWLLDWNIKDLKVAEILEKYEFDNESTFWKALDNFRSYNLPIREKSKLEVDWNDDWFLQRFESGFADWKKLPKNSQKKNKLILETPK